MPRPVPSDQKFPEKKSIVLAQPFPMLKGCRKIPFSPLLLASLLSMMIGEGIQFRAFAQNAPTQTPAPTASFESFYVKGLSSSTVAGGKQILVTLDGRTVYTTNSNVGPSAAKYFSDFVPLGFEKTLADAGSLPQILGIINPSDVTIDTNTVLDPGTPNASVPIMYQKMDLWVAPGLDTAPGQTNGDGKSSFGPADVDYTFHVVVVPQPPRSQNTTSANTAPTNTAPATSGGTAAPATNPSPTSGCNPGDTSCNPTGTNSGGTMAGGGSMGGSGCQSCYPDPNTGQISCIPVPC